MPALQGTLLEKFLTVPESEFKTLMRSSPAPAEGEEDKRREAYRYAKVRSSLTLSRTWVSDYVRVIWYG
jgi:hypothetical protein